ncbi:dmX-like protein 1 isoform X1 [Brienomyrus brachyistius]|uniref:dmX-like protein 1 isoform X1 n=1 Tax=Brienomyrus brachyistius TaxID=42636 RepID=UPI0020B37295|nr:dmX-like protein 1 isoform X1 [Brienomyrus brachyistius]
MNLHQVLTGAVNPGDNCFAVGNVNDEPFTAYASGCDIIILGSNFERLQIIPGVKHGNVQVGCVDSSLQGGLVAASYGNVVCIFEPVPVPDAKEKATKLSYQWQKRGQIVLKSAAINLAWDPTGTQLLTGSASLQLWSNDRPDLDPREAEEPATFGSHLSSWRCIWKCKTASPIHLMKFSPSGEFFATAGQDDCLVKVWYNTSRWQSGGPALFTPPEQASYGETDFSFVYLAHPRSVTGFSWRKTSKYMPRGSVCNVLLTCCKDSVCRLWAETLLPGDNGLSRYTGGHRDSLGGEALRSTANMWKTLPNVGMQERSSLELKLKESWRGPERCLGHPAYTGFLPHQQDRHRIHWAKGAMNANALCHFHIAASINPATDIPLLPSISSLCVADDEEPAGPFTVHWLNNKELHLTLAMEVYLQQLRATAEQRSPELSSRSDEERSDEDESVGSPTKARPTRDPGAWPGVPLAGAQVDHKLGLLLEDWNKAADMLFSIHPTDGSLLVWHVDWLDEYQPRMFRQAQVSFVSRIPVAFPTGDANSLSRSVVMYACNKNLDLAIQQGRQRPAGLPRSASTLIGSGQGKGAGLRLSIFTPNVLMISKHADGSLNQWAVSFAEESAFSTVLSVSHKSRYCGHRFHLNGLACHPLLPLLLTTSHHNTPHSPSLDPTAALLLGPPSPGGASPDPNAIYSELILWRVDPVGPLSFSGGVSELARINSLHTSAFSNVAWLPVLIPSRCLGAYGNSPSACFVASDGHSLRLYQAVIEAKKLLSELSNPETSRYVGEVFSIVSQQSTARPGCIISLDAITDFQGKKTQLLHVFEEDLILCDGGPDHAPETPTGYFEGPTGPSFSARFFLVVMEYSQSGRTLLHMWHLQLSALQASAGVPLDSSSYPPGSPERQSTPKNPTNTSNLQSASRLQLSSRRVYSEELRLPDGVEVLQGTPSAGHLSSSSLHPAGRAPYLLATSCSDHKVRFWRCQVIPQQAPSGDQFYSWEEWPLLVETALDDGSAVSVPGRPIEVSCCHTSRIAVAYRPMDTGVSHRVQVGIFQCESTGGSRWMLEQTFGLEEAPLHKVDGSLSLASLGTEEASDDSSEPGTRTLVHLDWVSREDGSHILTVAIGPKLLMYGLLPGKPPELGLSDGWRDGSSRLVLLRVVDLVSSVEGSPPIPVSLSWVRDGILVVGMDCEMHVYSQWQPPPQVGSAVTGSVTSLLAALRQAGDDPSSPQPPRRNLTRSMTSLAQKLSGKRTAYDLPADMEDCGLFEAAHHLFPTLPQYHPAQLMGLMDLGRVRRAKAILVHLVKCIAGEVVALRDGGDGHERRLRSLSISASGSTARDPKIFSKSENPDYTEIDSIPPLPLYALLAADGGGTAKPDNVGGGPSGSTWPDTYNELFQAAAVEADPDLLEGDREEVAKVIDLSRYGPTFFGLDHAQVLSGHLLYSRLPGLTRMEQMSLMALADTIATTSTDIGESQGKCQGGETLDECGLKFLLAVRLHTFLLKSLPPAHRAQLVRQGLSTCHFAWAFHSEAEEELLNMLPTLQKDDPTWHELRAMGVGWWLRSSSRLRRCMEKVAKAAFQRNNDPLDAAIFYLAMKKKAVVWGLYRSQQNVKMTAFFSNNFSEDRWRRAALKNAFSLLGKQRFLHSIAFFLLAGSLKDAVEVCLDKMQDLQLALVISRLYESEFEASSTYRNILHRHVLGHEAPAQIQQDPFLRSMAHWILEDYSQALDTLLVQPEGRVAVPSPEVFNFYTYLRMHPLLLRRHFRHPESRSSAQVGLATETRLADSITLLERRLFFSAAYAHLQAGCPMLALEVLSKMPKVIKKSRPAPCQDMSAISPSTRDSLLSVEAKQDRASDLDWSQPVLNGYESASDSLSNSRSDSAFSFDWSQPSGTMQEEPLELKWDTESEDDESGLAMKNVKAESVHAVSKDNTESSSVTESEGDLVTTSEDILTAQLKFTACLRILTTELRTLATGYELDGGRLRCQLCHWLEREVAALQHSCSYNPDLEEVTGGIAGGPAQDEPSQNPEGQLGTSLCSVELQRRRRQWLRQNEPLLRMFLSYSSLHGSHGGGLASVRMELILLLQESQQDESVASAALVLAQPKSSIPLLLACMASAKTVVANPIMHLSNLTHDILNTINSLDAPPHPSVVDGKIYVMHTLAASLSACVYQCLCDCRSLRHANQFTGIVYQSFLLSQQQPMRTMSTEEAVLPNTSPAQWPGMAALIRLLSSTGEETQSGLTVLLCEVLTAVYLSLFVHGLATHSSNELFRIVAHPLNAKLWAAVFGGGSRIPFVERPSPSRMSSVSSIADDLDRKPRRFRLRSSQSASMESAQGPPSPVVEQEASIFKENFVPPELSIWDYFIAKPFLAPSESRVEYDSEESQGSEDENEDEDQHFFDSNTALQEHSNANSYSWCLMRLAMVQLVLVNLKSFYPLAGHELQDLPVGSPLCHNVLKTLQRWEQLLQKRLEVFGGPPPQYISTQPPDDTLSGGPAILRHKALLEPSNTPFRSSRHSALPVRRLWQYLVKQEAVQETFIRNIFTKKREQNESVEDRTDSNTHSVAEDRSHNQIESDSGYPGGRARIIHKESDIITAFAINKANRNCLAIASSHDIQELDVSSILATQILTWVDDEAENKGGEDFLVIHAREDFTVHGTTPYTNSSPGTPINMPWLGSMQTGRGASVMIKRNINNVRRMTSHPNLPYYLTGAQDGSVRMFEWGHSQQIICYRSPGNSRVTRVRFNHQGNKFGIVDADGALSLWQTNMTANAPKPYLTLQCHNKTANDFMFVGSSSLIATAGLSTDNRNVCLWDTLVAPINSLVHAFSCHDTGATVLSLAPRQQLLISGGRKGWISVLDLNLRTQRQTFQAHDSAVKALAVDPTETCFISGSSEGNIKVWGLADQGLLHVFPNEHARQSLFRNLGTGVMQLEVGTANHIFSCGADGTMKMRMLPDRFGVSNGNLWGDVRFVL